MGKIKLGFCMTGSFCTFEPVIAQMEILSHDYDILPIFSFNASCLDTRFGKACEHIARVEDICGKSIITSIENAEPIGPNKFTDIMLVAPCTGNTLAKLALGITDSPVTMAVKSHLRNARPAVIAVSTNDALSGSAKNIAVLQNYRNFFFVPYRQDNIYTKPTSLVANFSKIGETLEAALGGRQIQPILG